MTQPDVDPPVGGDPPPDTPPPRSWRRLLDPLVIAVAVALVLVAVLVTRALAPGVPRLALVGYRSTDLAMLVPTGYRDEDLSAPFGTAIAGWLDPGDPRSSEKVQAVAPSGGRPGRRAQRRYGELRRLAGFVGGPPVEVTFPGGRPAWVLEYLLGAQAHALFEFDACTPAIAMAVSISAPNFAGVDRLAVILPQNAEPICDGPAFTARDRADPAIPLRIART